MEKERPPKLAATGAVTTLMPSLSGVGAEIFKLWHRDRESIMENNYPERMALSTTSYR